MQQVILLDEGWKKLKEGGVMKIEEILEDMQGGVYKSKISTDQYSDLYTTVYTMCTQKPPNNWSEHLYNHYCDAVKEYLSARILPRIKEKHDEAMLKVLSPPPPPPRPATAAVLSAPQPRRRSPGVSTPTHARERLSPAPPPRPHIHPLL